MTELEFDALARQGYNRIPVVQEGLADLYTPLSVYLRLADAPYSYLLESVVGGERFGRYSFIGLPARTVITVRGQHTEVTTNGEVVETHEGDPLAFIESFESRFKVPPRPSLPRFAGGLVGYFGYDTIRLIEKKLAKCDKPDPIGAPDIQLLLSEEIAIFDNLSGKLYLIVYADPSQPHAFTRAHSRLHDLRMQLREPVRPPRTEPTPTTTAKSEFGEANFKAAVEKAQQYIVDGDIMQVVLSQRMSMRFEQSPITLYRALRSLNPSPYMFYYQLGDIHIVGASPEILVRHEGGTVTVRPIAGTRPRGKTREEDLALEAELLADPKEVAEHVMLMDLGRNDIGRVAQTGSIKITDNRIIERYSHVMHIVSSVEAALKPGMSNIDILRATFPAGTVSGAPKVRAMQIIDEFEPTKRGIYSGAVGYLGFNGDMDVAIALRTAVIKDKTLYVQAGAGIVADSVPSAEWQETQNKARAVLRAAELAQKGLDA
ncbi:anthranilate synthase component I [Chitinimonas sp. BJB300]|uniref:anthranilate synthase component I n=1 Tax=Chitinimonas sp. BJB300 TaxID=1559339 RepID=UPI000C10BC0F|nr:anthranilate synthase component I [Chitinimonas sp. BJB300]PHV13139.1 anthranilate synthase component I [Chitinimonas sp. BJB300]TSJ84736.1 anthranilate synthase component I [Chitinimonas sp. BJB300]